MSRSHRHDPNPWQSVPRALVLWVLVAAMVSGCSATLRPIEPPVVRVSGLTLLDNGNVSLDLMVTNLNPIALAAKQATLTLMVQDLRWIETQQTIDWAIAPNAREVVTVQAPTLSAQAQGWLAEVSQGQRPSLPWSLTVTMTLSDDRVIESEGSGFLYRTPGQPARFR